MLNVKNFLFEYFKSAPGLVCVLKIYENINNPTI